MALCSSAFAEITIHFSPYENCEKYFIELINSATREIKISCFGLTNDNIYNALLKKQKEGVKILVCEDRMQSGSKHDKRDPMRKSGMEVVVKKAHVLEHNKMIEVDDRDSIIGSWNLSGNAQAQDNSIVVFKDENEIAVQIESAIDRIYERDKP